ncbi:hypothetical protein [Halococcus sediminicola]|uniref:hypothetical protein n=1 Tax=Halococcus sediminicola TaxID=1264579 RepID=UPI001F44C3AE|nr:hypothetical protein [Halococcus sediminicola]
MKEQLRVGDAVFLVDGMAYLTALAKTNLTGHLDYSERSIIKKLFQTYTMRIGRFHETWNGGQFSAEHWPPTHYYNHLRGHQALDNCPCRTAGELDLTMPSSASPLMPYVIYRCL